MNSNKPYLVFMAGPNSVEDLREMVDPIKDYIRGVCAILHDSDEFSPEAVYLLGINNKLGAGNIIFGEYVNDHSHSRNRILKETGLKEEDFYCQVDTLERVPEDFAQNFLFWQTQMIQSGVDIINFYSKPYLVRYREDMLYVHTPHESLISLTAKLSIIELNHYKHEESKVRINMRPIKRADQPFHFVAHYVKYLLQPNSNQNWLGLEHHGGPEALPRLEFLRKSLIKSLRDNGFNRSVDGVINLLKLPLNEFTRPIVNEHKQINDFYRFFVLNDYSVIDSHNWSKLPQF